MVSFIAIFTLAVNSRRGSGERTLKDIHRSMFCYWKLDAELGVNGKLAFNLPIDIYAVINRDGILLQYQVRRCGGWCHVRKLRLIAR
jgi:hypothetical protein